MIFDDALMRRYEKALLNLSKKFSLKFSNLHVWQNK